MTSKDVFPISAHEFRKYELFTSMTGFIDKEAKDDEEKTVLLN
jgi:hypothetical protein